MKVIFLDIDGVLNSDRSIFILKMKEFPAKAHFTSVMQNRYNYLMSKVDPIAVQVLNRIVEDTSAKIVVSSANRIPLGKDGVIETLYDMGVEADIIDVTLSTRSGNRGSQIQEWLDRHEVESYVILDDSSDMLATQLMNFVRVNPEIGLSWNDLNKAKRILGVEDESLILRI